MASVQERLQLKRIPLENWSISEQLYLASAVACSGDQNWMSVSRQLKTVCGNNRPNDWFSAKTCAAQYNMLMENVEPTKRKKRNEKDTGPTTVETPVELIVRRLTQERLAELNKLIQEEGEQYQKIQTEIANIQNDVYDENQLRLMVEQMENEEKQREREKQNYNQWIKERDERATRFDKKMSPNQQHFHQSPTSNIHSPALTQHLNQRVKVEEMEVDDPNAKQGTSPLLTSLLKSPSAAPNPSPSMLHNLPNQQARVAAPTITNLLTGTVTNLSSSLAAAAASSQTGIKTIASSVSANTASYPTSLHHHHHPLTGPAPNDQSMGNIAQSPSQAAPTLSMLLENKQKENILKMPPLSRIDSQNLMGSMDQQSSSDASTKNEQADPDFTNAESPIKDDDQQLMEVFGELPDDIGELADIILDDLINEEQKSAVSNVAENLESQVNLDLKTFQSPPAHSTEANVEIEGPSSLNENPCDSTVVNSKMESAFDELKMKEQKNNLTPPNMGEEHKIKSDITNDDDSDLSNDTPLSELIRQETSAKQLRSQAHPAADISSTTEQPDEIAPEVEQQPDQPDEEDTGDVSINLEEEKIDDTVDLLDAQDSEPEELIEPAQQDKQNEFDTNPVDDEEKPSNEINMPIDSFESDSNEEKSMEHIKRKIEALPELKDSNSSENSQDEKISHDDIELIEEKSDTDHVEQIQESPTSLNDNENVEQIEESVTIENDDENDEVVEIEPSEKEETVDSTSMKDEITDLTTTKDEAIEQSEPEDALCDTEVERSEPTEHEKVESMETEPIQAENVESPEQEKKDEQIVDSTVADNVVEILDDEIFDNVGGMQEEEAQNNDDIKAEADSSQPEINDLIEIKSDDEKQEPGSPDVKEIKIEDPASSVKIEIIASPKDSKRKSVTPTPAERKVSTDDELFEDARETLDVEEVLKKPSPKPVTPAIAIDTDDDSPIEVVKEEKTGAKRDYSRRKKDQSHTEKRIEEPTPIEDVGGSISSRLRLKDRDRSESPFTEDISGEPAKSRRRYSTIDSLPNSPASSDDREYRSWKKSILLVYNDLSQHKCASLFQKPITEEQAPNYKTVILYPMDLQSLKRNIDSGQIRSTIEFQRYVMLMCHNAIFYNINDDVTCQRAKEMLSDAIYRIQEFQVTWKLETEKMASASNSTGVQKSIRGRKSTRLTAN